MRCYGTLYVTFCHVFNPLTKNNVAKNNSTDIRGLLFLIAGGDPFETIKTVKLNFVTLKVSLPIKTHLNLAVVLRYFPLVRFCFKISLTQKFVGQGL